MIVDRYYYNQLNTKEKAIYKAFYDGVMSYKDIIPIPVKGIIKHETVNRVFSAITRDNPLVYFLNQSACSFATDMFGHSAICPQYFYDEATIKKYNKKIQDTVNGLAAKLKLTEGSDYDKELKIHDWMCNNVSYDEQGDDIKQPQRVIEAHNIIGVFAKHTAQCEGIAKAVKVLLNALDVKCIVATGTAIDNGVPGPHAWNIVNIQGKPYQLDVTWDICGMENKDRMAYDYLNLNDGVMGKTHKADAKLPTCNSLDMNYFTNNKRAFKTKVMLLAYIESALSKGISEFYFRVDERLDIMSITQEIGNIAAKKMVAQGQRGVRIQQIPNENVGTCWIKIY